LSVPTGMRAEVKAVDASAVAALLFGEPDAEAVAGRLENARLVAPALIDYELANVCLMKLRRQPARRDALLTAFALRENLGIEVLGMNQSEVLTLAETSGLTAYDASYLWIARSLEAELVTLDKRLAFAAAGD